MIPMTAKSAKTKPEAVATKTEAADMVTMMVPRCDIGIAPENPRADVPADDEIPNMAETLVTDDGCGQVVPIYVRRGKRSELPWMALDGRRRLFGFDHLLAEGRIENDHPVRITICETKEQIARAVVLLNTERLQPHPADSIEAIAKLLKKNMSPDQIGRALGYKKSEMNKLIRLASVHPRAIEAFRAGKLQPRHLRMLARLEDQDLQRAHADRVLDGFYFDDVAVQSMIRGDKATTQDPRFVLVTMAEYAEAGGRIEQDLFGEFPDSVLDTPLLDELWQGKVAQITDILAERGVEIFIAAKDRVEIPAGMEAPWNYLSEHQVGAELKAQFNADRRAVIDFETEIKGLVQSGEFDAQRIAEYLWANAELYTYEQVQKEIGAITLFPHRETGVTARPALKAYVPPVKTEDEIRADQEAAEAKQAAEDARSAYAVTTHKIASAPRVKVDVEGLNNSLHERRTDVATKGLIRDLADDPDVALTVLAAKLLTSAVTHEGSYNFAARITCDLYSSRFEVIPELDGEVRLRVRAWKDRLVESQKRPIAFVHGLSHADRLQLIADLVALSLDLKEVGTGSVSSSRRADAAEIQELLGSDISRHWTPDAEFLAAHSKGLLLKMADDLKLDTTSLSKAKKHEIVASVEEAALSARYVPKGLDWSIELLEADQADFDSDDEEEGEADDVEDTAGDDQLETPEDEVELTDPTAGGAGAEAPANDAVDDLEDIVIDADLHDELGEDAMHFADDDIAA